MTEESWLKYAAMSLAAAGFLATIGFSIVSDDNLEGEAWIVSGIDARSGASGPVAGTVLTAIFDDASLSGTSGCNSYFTSYDLDGDSIAIGLIGSTLAFCSEPDGVMDQESAYLALLGKADRFERDGDQLTLRHGNTVLVTYDAATPELFDQ